MKLEILDSRRYFDHDLPEGCTVYGFNGYRRKVRGCVK